jgi:hypothetical protein
MTKHTARLIGFVLCAGMLASSAFADHDGGENRDNGGNNQQNNFNNNNNNNNQQNNGNRGSGTLLEAQLLGSAPNQPIAGVLSGGAPWMVAASEATLSNNGNLDVEIQGLLISAGTSIKTIGPVVTVKASLTCGGVVATTTAPVNLSTAGNAEIHQTLTLPSACIAPAILIRIDTTTSGPSATGPWIAATGFTTGNPPAFMDDEHR